MMDTNYDENDSLYDNILDNEIELLNNLISLKSLKEVIC